ncbi:kinase-like domain-containing protein [Coniochaeta sp. 2T2.1]|nr:kinase-like domain-containing protein [Coniochaeta sp. 2T2.1]
MSLLPDNVNEISAKVLEALVGTPHECVTLAPLSGGNANFSFRGQLAQHAIQGDDEFILVKHGEDYLARNQRQQVTTDRCRAEADALQALHAFPPTESGGWVIRTPRLHAFYEESNIQIQEYIPFAQDLKRYIIECSQAGAPPTAWSEDMARFGHALGTWLGRFHEWGARPEHAELKRVATANKEIQRLKHLANYYFLVLAVDKFPALLGDAREVFEQVKAMADAEIEDESKLQVTHGDFWTGNILLRTDEELGSRRSASVVDWEVLSLGVPARDLGQMLAELYMLKHFKDIDAGLWMMREFVKGYAEATNGIFEDETAFRIAIHLGMHVIVIGGSVPGWGSLEDVVRVVTLGKEIIIRAWKKDGTWFEGSDLAFLFV